MGDAGRMTIDVSRGEHRQQQRTKLLDELTVAAAEFPWRADREFDRAPGAAYRRAVGTRACARRHQGIKGQIRLGKFVGPSPTPRADAGPGLRIRTRSGGDQQYFNLVGKPIAGSRWS